MVLALGLKVPKPSGPPGKKPALVAGLVVFIYRFREWKTWLNKSILSFSDQSILVFTNNQGNTRRIGARVNSPISSNAEYELNLLIPT